MTEVDKLIAESIATDLANLLNMSSAKAKGNNISPEAFLGENGKANLINAFKITIAKIGLSPVHAIHARELLNEMKEIDTAIPSQVWEFILLLIKEMQLHKNSKA